MRKFHKKQGPRRSFLKSLMHNLIVKGALTTTVDRAREVRVLIERLVTLAKRHDTAHLRMLISRLPHRSSAYLLFHDIAPRYANRAGGYTRITKQARVRKRDGARVARIEFV